MTTMTVLKPGDKVLVTFDQRDNQDAARDCLTKLRERFPDVEFTMLHGAESVIVKHQEEQ